ncbi:MAG: hypothetical protein WDO15_13625 [Bacteroidota bacterium]
MLTYTFATPRSWTHPDFGVSNECIIEVAAFIPLKDLAEFLLDKSGKIFVAD